MSTTLEVAENLSDLVVNTNDLKKEISRLKKLITLGFEGDNKGVEKVAKVFGSEDQDEIKKLYDNIGNIIKAIYIQGSFENFSNYLKNVHSVNLQSCNFSLKYKNNSKKIEKYKEEFEYYFLEPSCNPENDIVRIQNSLTANFKEIKIETDNYKEEFNTQANNISDTKETLKTITKILVQSKTKDIEVKDVVTDIEEKIQEQEVALTILNNKEK